MKGQGCGPSDRCTARPPSFVHVVEDEGAGRQSTCAVRTPSPPTPSLPRVTNTTSIASTIRHHQYGCSGRTISDGGGYSRSGDQPTYELVGLRPPEVSGSADRARDQAYCPGGLGLTSQATFYQGFGEGQVSGSPLRAPPDQRDHTSTTSTHHITKSHHITNVPTAAPRPHHKPPAGSPTIAVQAHYHCGKLIPVRLAGWSQPQRGIQLDSGRLGRAQ